MPKRNKEAKAQQRRIELEKRLDIVIDRDMVLHDLDVIKSCIESIETWVMAQSKTKHQVQK